MNTRPALSPQTCLPAPPPRQVEEREQLIKPKVAEQAAQTPAPTVRTPTRSPLKNLTNTLGKVKAKYARRKARREERQIDATAATVENDWAVSWMNDKSSPVLAPWEQELVQGMQDGSVPECGDFKLGRCQRGDLCRYSHAGAGAGPVPLARFFLVLTGLISSQTRSQI